MKFNFLLIIILSCISFSLQGQYKISGYIKTDVKEKKVYLSILQFNEENAIYRDQILTYTKTDSTGYFQISGNLLSEKNKLYRVHTNEREYTEGLDFIENGKRKNYCNFIFSNTDTIYFPKGDWLWFENARFTNQAHAQWQQSIWFEKTLRKEYSKSENEEAKNKANAKFIQEFKSFCKDSLNDPLVKLLAYAHIKKNTKSIDLDYAKNPEFYNEILDELKHYYHEDSYYLQYRNEMQKFTNAYFQAKASFYKTTSIVLSFVVVILFVLIIVMHLKNTKKNKKSPLPELTKQEIKVAKLICSGKTNKEIAEELFISVNTVKTHISNINSKLKVGTRDEIIQKLKNHTGY